MAEIITVGVGAIAAYLGKDGVQKILGPTADYLGEELKAFTQRRVENTAKIFLNAKKKLGPRLDSPGQVPPKVLKTVINEGSYSEDPIALEYFGGVLASSRTEIGRDDRGARIIKTLDNLWHISISDQNSLSHIFNNCTPLLKLRKGIWSI